MLISIAYAQDAGGAAPPNPTGDLFGMVVPLLAIGVIFYFLLIRPQQKKVKEHKALIAGVRRGDRIVTGGGILGVVTKVVNDTEVQVEIAEGVRVKVLKSTIADVPSRTGVVPAAGASRADNKRAADDEDQEDVPESSEATKN